MLVLQTTHVAALGKLQFYLSFSTSFRKVRKHQFFKSYSDNVHDVGTSYFDQQVVCSLNISCNRPVCVVSSKLVCMKSILSDI